MPRKPAGIADLRKRLEQLQTEMLNLEHANLSEDIRPEHLAGARNLLHYVALRRHDIRELQQYLAALGLSSLGRTESHVLGAIRAVLGMLDHLVQSNIRTGLPLHQTGLQEGRQVLDRNTDALLGAAPPGRRVRIMVTMPPEAATDAGLVRRLLASGMNCMRINCAHDGPDAWAAMIRNLRLAEAECRLSCTIQMDLTGPKLRTGPIEPGPSAVKLRPRRDALGRIQAPARVWLTPVEQSEIPPTAAAASLPVDSSFLSRLKPDMRIRFVDTRGARRSLIVRQQVGRSWWADAFRGAYLAPGVGLTTVPPDRRFRPRQTVIGPLPSSPQRLTLASGDTLVLTASLHPGRPATRDDSGAITSPARIGVTLPQFFSAVRPNEPIWFDDGAIGGVITSVSPGEVRVRILHARPGGDKLGAEKGMNIPDTALDISPLTAEDIAVLPFIAAHADVVGLSFVKTPDAVRELRSHIAALGRDDLRIVLKIETRQGFENLPQLLMEAMRSGPVGVMIARGDLAIECGFERLAEIQEEILWICEAAHVPVIWATQVLESLAKTGRPSRSEITDAAMGERAECVMLNKGPFIVEAVQVLDGILQRMESHQEKKTSMLRKLNVAAAFSSGKP